jgi:hypothetical protein
MRLREGEKVSSLAPVMGSEEDEAVEEGAVPPVPVA